MEEEKKQEKKDDNLFVVAEPKVMNDPDCDHDWKFIFRDGDGRDNFMCTKCPMGKAVNPE